MYHKARIPVISDDSLGPVKEYICRKLPHSLAVLQLQSTCTIH